MEHALLSHSDYSVYPGEYTPLLKDEAIKEELKLTYQGDSILPPGNVKEFSDSYKIEVAIPGIKREEFLIRGDRNMISIIVRHADSETNEKERFHLHEFNYERVSGKILLPGDADAAFAIANYRCGMLCLHVPKERKDGRYAAGKIIVY